MASMEQLQMLDDDDSSSSSSSSSDNTSDDDDEEDETENDDVTENDDIENDEKSMSNEDASEAPSAAVSATTSADPVHHKKRIKLSLGGKFKVTLSSPKQEPKNESTTKDSSTSVATDSGKSAKLASVSLKPKVTTPSKPVTVNIKTKSPSTKVANTSIGTKPPNTTKDQKSKPKITIPKPAASTGAKSSKPKDNTKRRQSPKLPISNSASTAPTTTDAPKKRSTTSTMRSIRITPMSSPGLLLPKGTPNEVFAQTMATAGYTKESRTKSPHRGSSVQRIVDDMFDSNVKFCVRFPKLVPEELLRNPPIKAPTATPATTTSSSDDPASTKEEPAPTSTAPKVEDSTPKLTEDRAAILMKRLVKAFGKTNDDKQPDSIASSDHSSKQKNNRIPQYSDMIPISLSSECPDAYIQKRLEYVNKVEERERAIVKMQDTLFDTPDDDETRKPNAIPPIPNPPTVPTRDDLRAMTTMEDLFGSDDQQQKSHPLYLPKSQEFVKHLDPRCFHAVDGRYFGLSSNAISDPYFFGPNAPGISGLSFSGSTGLATASTVGNAGLGPQLFMMPAQPSSSIAAANQKVASTTTTTTTTATATTTVSTTKTTTTPQAPKDLSKSYKPVAPKPVA